MACLFYFFLLHLSFNVFVSIFVCYVFRSLVCFLERQGLSSLPISDVILMLSVEMIIDLAESRNEGLVPSSIFGDLTRFAAKRYGQTTEEKVTVSKIGYQ